MPTMHTWLTAEKCLPLPPLIIAEVLCYFVAGVVADVPSLVALSLFCVGGAVAATDCIADVHIVEVVEVALCLTAGEGVVCVKTDDVELAKTFCVPVVIFVVELLPVGVHCVFV